MLRKYLLLGFAASAISLLAVPAASFGLPPHEMMRLGFAPYPLVYKLLTTRTILKVGTDVNIAEGETFTGNVISVLGTVNVRGKVDGNVISIAGEIKLGSGGEITKDLAVFLNKIDAKSGSKTGRSTFEVNPPGLDVLKKAVKFWADNLILNLIIMLVLIAALVWLFIGYVVPRLNITGMVRMITRNAPVAFLYGLLGIIAFKLASLILFVTIVGSGAAIVLCVVAKILGILGFIAVIVYAGSVVNAALKASLSSVAQFILGLVLLVLVGLVPVLGWLVLLALGVVGFGALLRQILA